MTEATSEPVQFYHLAPFKGTSQDGKMEFEVSWPENGEPTIEINGVAANESVNHLSGSIIFGMLDAYNDLKARYEGTDAADVEEMRTQLTAEKALRIAAEEQTIQAEKRYNAAWRLVLCLRDAVSPFAECFGDSARMADLTSDPAFLARLCEQASETYDLHTGDLPNYEDVIRDRRQEHVLAWAIRTFGPEAASPLERALRFLEESVELYQATTHGQRGIAFDAIKKTVERVYSRPVGDVRREVGGVAVTLLALCEVAGVRLAEAERDEWGRVQSIPRREFQARHAIKAYQGITDRG